MVASSNNISLMFSWSIASKESQIEVTSSYNRSCRSGSQAKIKKWNWNMESLIDTLQNTLDDEVIVRT